MGDNIIIDSGTTPTNKPQQPAVQINATIDSGTTPTNKPQQPAVQINTTIEDEDTTDTTKTDNENLNFGNETGVVPGGNEVSAGSHENDFAQSSHEKDLAQKGYWFEPKKNKTIDNTTDNVSDDTVPSVPAKYTFYIPLSKKSRPKKCCEHLPVVPMTQNPSPESPDKNTNDNPLKSGGAMGDDFLDGGDVGAVNTVGAPAKGKKRRTRKTNVELVYFSPTTEQTGIFGGKRIAPGIYETTIPAFSNLQQNQRPSRIGSDVDNMEAENVYSKFLNAQKETNEDLVEIISESEAQKIENMAKEIKENDMDLMSGYTVFSGHARKNQVLTPEEEKELSRRILEENDPVAFERFVLGNLRIVIACARQLWKHFAKGNSPIISFMDLVQEGLIGLMIAAARFDYRRNTRFCTYGVQWIHQRMRRATYQNKTGIYLPGHAGQSIQTMRGLINLYNQGHEKEIPKKFLRRVKILAKVSAPMISIEGYPANDENSVTVCDEQREIFPQVEILDELYAQFFNEDFKRLLKKTISPQGYDILSRRFGFGNYNYPQTLKQIGAIYNRSQEYIRIIIQTLLKDLKNNPDMCKFYSSLRAVEPNMSDLPELEIISEKYTNRKKNKRTEEKYTEDLEKFEDPEEQNTEEFTEEFTDNLENLTGLTALSDTPSPTTSTFEEELNKIFEQVELTGTDQTIDTDYEATEQDPKENKTNEEELLENKRFCFADIAHKYKKRYIPLEEFDEETILDYIDEINDNL